MWSFRKPILTNRLVLKPLKSLEKKKIIKKYFLSVLKVREFFNFNLYFLNTKDLEKYKYLLSYNHHYIFGLSSIIYSFFDRKKNAKDILFSFLVDFLIVNIRLYNKTNLFFNKKNKEFQFLSDLTNNIKKVFLNDLIFYFKFNFFKEILLFLPFSNLFFFNAIFIFFFFKFSDMKIFINKKKKTLVFYNSFFFIKNIFINKYFHKLLKLNKLLLIQKGILKWDSYYSKKGNIFSSSIQLIDTKINFYLKLNFLTNSSSFKRLEKKYKSNKSKLDGIYLWNWNLFILPFCINKIYYIYNGNKFVRLKILPAMVGHKFGEFSYTWKIYTRGLKISNKFKNII